MKPPVRVLLLALAAALPAYSQFALYQVAGSAELQVGRSFDLACRRAGQLRRHPVPPAQHLHRHRHPRLPAGERQRIHGHRGRPAADRHSRSETVGRFHARLPVGRDRFDTASLDTIGISVMLSANVPAELTTQLQTATGPRPLYLAPVDFGVVERGSSAIQHVILLNQTPGSLIAPPPLVTGGGFSLSGPSPGGVTVKPGASTIFDVQFSPTADGPQSGILTIGDRTYTLAGTGIDPPLPRPRISLSLAQAASAQQGSVSVNLESAAPVSGSGTVTLSFTPVDASVPPDPAIAFASGGQTAAFTVSPGDTQGRFGADPQALFQTGTTAGPSPSRWNWAATLTGRPSPSHRPPSPSPPPRVRAPRARSRST